MSFPDWLRSRVFHVAKIWAMCLLVDCMLATFVQESLCVWHCTVKSLCFYFYLLSPLTLVPFSFSCSLLFHSVSPGFLSSALPSALAATELYTYILFKPKKNRDQLECQQRSNAPRALKSTTTTISHFQVKSSPLSIRKFSKSNEKSTSEREEKYERMVDITRLTSPCP